MSLSSFVRVDDAHRTIEDLRGVLDDLATRARSQSLTEADRARLRRMRLAAFGLSLGTFDGRRAEVLRIVEGFHDRLKVRPERLEVLVARLARDVDPGFAFTVEEADIAFVGARRRSATKTAAYLLRRSGALGVSTRQDLDRLVLALKQSRRRVIEALRKT